MKKILALICCIVVLSKAAMAQKDSLAFDDHGKYIYYKVVNIEQLKLDTLYNRGIYFVSNAYDKNTMRLASQDSKNASLTAIGGFSVSKKTSLARHQDGQVSYKLTVEIKDAKYRFWLTDFVLTPYYRDRYNNYVPDNAIVMPLEVAVKKLSQRDFNDYLDQVGVFSKQVGDRLHQYMKQGNVVKKDIPKKVITINKW